MREASTPYKRAGRGGGYVTAVTATCQVLRNTRESWRDEFYLKYEIAFEV